MNDFSDDERRDARLIQVVDAIHEDGQRTAITWLVEHLVPVARDGKDPLDFVDLLMTELTESFANVELVNPELLDRLSALIEGNVSLDRVVDLRDHMQNGNLP